MSEIEATGRIQITESRGGDLMKVTDIDFASVLRYFGFTMIEVGQTKATKKRRGKPLTEYTFEVMHPKNEMKMKDLIIRYDNDQLECSPRRLLAEARHLRNRAHSNRT